MLLLLAVSAASADDIVFTELAVSADQGVTLSYTLDPTSAEAVARLGRMGVYPRIAVRVASGGLDKTSHVELKEPRRTVTLDSQAWPTGLTATVELVEPVAPLDRLRSPQGSGAVLYVAVQGGTAGAQPLGMPARTSTSNTRSTTTVQVEPVAVDPVAVDPVAVDPAALLAAAQAQAAQAEQQRVWAEQQQRIAEERARIQAYLQGVFADPTHPVHAACAAGLTGGAFEDCVNVAAFRDDGAAEVSACVALSEIGARSQCVESLPKRRYPAAAAITACVEAFGSGEPGLRCTNAVVESPDDPTDDVRSCAAGFTGPERLACITRLRGVEGDAGDLIGACSAAFRGEAARECVSIGADARVAALVPACRAGFADDKWAIECLIALRPAAERGVALVPVCGALFATDKDRLQCLERGRQDPDPERIGACAGVEGRRRLRCVEGE